MCMGVIIERPGQRRIHCETVRELARWFEVLVQDAHYPNTKLNRMAEHCLCPIDVRESARLSGYVVEPDEGHIDWIAR